MGRFSRPDKVMGVFEPIVGEKNYEGLDVVGRVRFSGKAGITDVETNWNPWRFWREGGKVYSEGDIRVLVFSGYHICLGRVPEGFRPSHEVYIGKGMGIHTADAQIRVNANGYIFMWVSPNIPVLASFDNSSTSTPSPVTGIVDKFDNDWADGATRQTTYYTPNVTNTDIVEDTTTQGMELVAFRCNSVWEVGDKQYKQ